MAHTDIFIAQYTIIMGYNIIQYLYFLYRYMSVLCSVGQNIDTLITLLLTFAYMMVFFSVVVNKELRALNGVYKRAKIIFFFLQVLKHFNCFKHKLITFSIFCFGFFLLILLYCIIVQQVYISILLFVFFIFLCTYLLSM